MAPDVFAKFAGKSSNCPKCGQKTVIGAAAQTPATRQLSAPASVPATVPQSLPAAVSPVSPPQVAGTVPAGRKLCPFCAEEIAEAAKKCRHCGEIVDVTLLRSHRSVSHIARKDSGVAALLSFLWPGAGHLYADQVGAGVALILINIVCSVLSVVTCVFLIPHLILYIWVIFDSVRAVNRYNEQAE